MGCTVSGRLVAHFATQVFDFAALFFAGQATLARAVSGFGFAAQGWPHAGAIYHVL